VRGNCAANLDGAIARVCLLLITAKAPLLVLLGSVAHRMVISGESTRQIFTIATTLLWSLLDRLTPPECLVCGVTAKDRDGCCCQRGAGIHPRLGDPELLRLHRGVPEDELFDKQMAVPPSGCGEVEVE
jgi:hypothetical protein